MPGLQVLSAPTNQPTLNPRVQSAPVQPTLAPRVVAQPVQPSLAPKVVTQPRQPTLSPQVVTQTPQPQINVDNSPRFAKLGQAVKAKYPGVYDSYEDGALGKIVAAKYPGVYDKLIDPATPVETPQAGAKGLGGFLLGAAKGVGNTLNTISQFGQKALQTITPGHTPTASISKEHLTPQGTAEKIGYGTEQVGEFFVPGGAVSKATKVAEAGVDALKFGSKAAGLLKLGTKAAISAGEAAGITALQGGNREEVKHAAEFGAAFPIAIKALKVLGSGAKETAKFIASSLSGVPKDAIEYALKNPKQVQSAITRAVAEGGDIAAQRISKNALDALDKLQEARGLNFKAGLSKLEKEATYTKNGQLYVKRVLSDAEAKATKGYVPGTEIGVPTNLSTKGVKQVATMTLKEFDINAKGKLIDWSQAAIDDTHAHKLQKLINRVYEWTDTTPTGLNNLRQVIDSYRLGGINLGSSEKKFNAIIGKLRTNLSEYLGGRVPQVAEMNSKYAAESEVINNIRSQLKLGSNDPNTALRKLINVFNPKSKVYRPIVEQLGDKAGVDLMSDIAGLTMAQWTPEGLGKYITTLVGGAQFGLGLANPASLVTIPATAAASSPRLVGKAATTLGKIDQSKAANMIKKAAPVIGLGAGVQLSR